MKINIIVDNDKCWHLNTIRRLIPFLKERKILVNKIWVLPEKLSNFKGLSILYWYLNIFGLMNFIKLSAFYILVLIQNIFKKTNSFKDLAKMNDIKCVYLKNINDLTLYDDLKKENKNYNLIFTNHIISQKLLDLKNNVFINKHSSLLPGYKGLMPFIWTKIFSAKNGVSVHLVSKEIDSGKIIFQKKIDYEFNSMVEFYIYIYENFPKYFVESLKNLEEENFFDTSYKESSFSLPTRKEFKQFLRSGGKIIQLNDFFKINKIIN